VSAAHQSGNRARAGGAGGRQPWDATISIPVRITDEELLTGDENEFSIPSYNKKGQSVRITIKIFPELEAAFKIMVERGGFPYVSIEDAFRHALQRHLVWLYHIRPILQMTAYTAARTVQQMMQHENLKAEIEGAIESYSKRLRELVDRGYIEAAGKLMERVRAIQSQIPNGPEKDKFDRFVELYAGKIEKEVSDRLALLTAKRMEKLADAAIAGEPVVQDSSTFGEEEATEFPIELLAEGLTRTLEEDLVGSPLRTANPPDLEDMDDYYSPTDIMVGEDEEEL